MAHTAREEPAPAPPADVIDLLADIDEDHEVDAADQDTLPHTLPPR